MKLKFNKIELEVNKKNLSAQALYKKFGFSVKDEGLNNIKMELSIN